jgi:hypothetical protein
MAGKMPGKIHTAAMAHRNQTMSACSNSGAKAENASAPATGSSANTIPISQSLR